MKKKIISLFLSVLMFMSILPMQAMASDDMVYISISNDGLFVESDVDQTVIAHLGIPLSKLEEIKLEDFGLERFITDENADEKEDITVLHLYLYVHQEYYGEGAENIPSTVSGGYGSIFFEWFWGHDCNLNYYVNGQYPLKSEGWGATADTIVLNPGDFVDVMMFTSWNFYNDSGVGFHNFFDKEGNITHKMNAKVGENLEFELKRGYGNIDTGGETEYVPAENVPVYYSKTGLYADDAESVESSGGSVSINFPSAGKWYVWMDGQKGHDMDTENIVSSPAYMEVVAEGGEKDVLFGDINGDGKVNSVDAALAYAAHNEKYVLSEEQKTAGDVNGDGKNNSVDAALIYAFHNEKLEKFPAEQ